MIVRIVKMSFKPENINEFLNLFEQKKQFIKNSTGCSLLELYREQQNSTVFFTYSYWNSKKDLENYRNSELFKDTWKLTKTMFIDKPIAWSVDKLVSLK